MQAATVVVAAAEATGMTTGVAAVGAGDTEGVGATGVETVGETTRN